ncbi:MAG: hypothetical protein HY673_09030, partial [Chloroflexi bacterium]|nr:hypothetical protein [Chloroflexota bacterium]
MAAATTGLLLLSVASPGAGAAQAPHEDPDTAPVVYDGVSLLQKYAEALDYVLARNAGGVPALQEQAAGANIPPQLRDTVDSFLSSGYSLAGLVAGIEADREKATTFASQFRPREMKESLESAGQKLDRAYAELRVMERGARDTGRVLGAGSAGGGSTLGKAYEEVEARLRRIRRLLDLLRETTVSLTRQTETALENLGGMQGMILQPTSLSLAVEPDTAFVGDTVQFQGSLRAGDKPLGSRQVTILLNGAPEQVVITDNSGSYRGHLVLPYDYVPEMALQALYYRQPLDMGLYVGSTSPETRVKVLFYT